MSKKGWDLKSRNSLESAASWIGKGSEASIVLVVRPADVAVYIDPKLQPYDAIKGIRDTLPGLLQHLIDQRARKAAKPQKKPPVNPDAEDPE